MSASTLGLNIEAYSPGFIGIDL